MLSSLTHQCAVCHRQQHTPDTTSSKWLQRTCVRTWCFRSLATATVLKPAKSTSLSVNAERVYTLEHKLTKFGFTAQQARTLLVTAASMRNIRQKVNYSNMSQVFHAAWEVEDEMLRAGFDHQHARKFGLMFVALAGCREDSNLRVEAYWRVWEVSAAETVCNLLESASGKKKSGYDLAKAMLTFAMQEWES